LIFVSIVKDVKKVVDIYVVRTKNRRRAKLVFYF